MSDRLIVVVSDLHASCGALDDFDSTLEGRFCDFLCTEAALTPSVELVINGDFLDFVQAAPLRAAGLRSASEGGVPLCYSEAESLAKLDTIHGAHRPLFEALGLFLAGGAGRRLVILPGNHDADFFWAGVRTEFSRKVCDGTGASPGQVLFYLERVYYPDPAQAIWIEHGHQYDVCNKFFVGEVERWSAQAPPILPDAQKVPRLLECVGTRLLHDYLNELDASYHFVDNVKPFSRFLSIFGTAALTPGYGGPPTAMAAVWGMLRYLGKTLRHHPRDFLGLDEARGEGPRPVLEEMTRRLDAEGRKAFEQALRAQGFPLPTSLSMALDNPATAEHLLDFLSDHPALLGHLPPPRDDELGLGGPEGTLTLLPAFSLDETKGLRKAARVALQRGTVKAVLMGHTHESQDRPGGLPYVNTGCWTRYYRFHPQEKIRRWPLLRSPSYADFPYTLQYAVVDPGRPEEVRLHTFDEKAQ